MNQTADLSLAFAYIENAQAAAENIQPEHVQFFLEQAKERLASYVPDQSSRPFHAAIGLDPGLKRKQNEDCTFAMQGVCASIQKPFGLFIVADGMGGHAHGQDASWLAIKHIAEYVFSHLSDEDEEVSHAHLLVEGVQAANTVIFRRNQEEEHVLHTDKMGTTATAALIIDTTCYVANVGDSRTYLYRPGQGLTKLTRDHSKVAVLHEAGCITVEEMYTHPERNQITRTVGTDPTVHVDHYHGTVQEGDVLLLCTDGVWEMTRDPHLETILAQKRMSAKQMVERVMERALVGEELHSGGVDNIGLIVVQMQKTGVVDFQTTASMTQYASLAS